MPLFLLHLKFSQVLLKDAQLHNLLHLPNLLQHPLLTHHPLCLLFVLWMLRSQVVAVLASVAVSGGLTRGLPWLCLPTETAIVNVKDLLWTGRNATTEKGDRAALASYLFFSILFCFIFIFSTVVVFCLLVSLPCSTWSKVITNASAVRFLTYAFFPSISYSYINSYPVFFS